MINHWDKIIHHKTEDETEPTRKKLYELDAYLMISLHSPAATHSTPWMHRHVEEEFQFRTSCRSNTNNHHLNHLPQQKKL